VSDSRITLQPYQGKGDNIFFSEMPLRERRRAGREERYFGEAGTFAAACCGGRLRMLRERKNGMRGFAVRRSCVSKGGLHGKSGGPAGTAGFR